MGEAITDFALIPIGTSPAWYNPGEPASGFLLQTSNYRVLVDCGSFVIAKYLELFGSEYPIDAIVLTHVHADHCFDLVPLKFGIDLGSLQGWKPQLWLPPGARKRLSRLVSAWDNSFEEFFQNTFDLHDYDTVSSSSVGPFSMSAVSVPHYIECCALRFDLDHASFGYTADTGPCEGLVEHMSGVDLLLSESALSVHDPTLSQIGRGHITGKEAGEIAQKANVHSLLLTHIPREIDANAVCAEASNVFSGPTQLAKSGVRYEVARRLAANID